MNVQAAVVDADDNLWVLDPSNPDDQAPVITGIKLLKINLTTNQVERTYRFEDLPRERTGLNDVRIDTQRQLAYLSDPVLAALVVLDLRTGKSRLALQGHKSTATEPGFVLRLDGQEVKDKTGKPFSSNVNGIALTMISSTSTTAPSTKPSSTALPPSTWPMPRCRPPRWPRTWKRWAKPA